ncbi:MAG: hypothetical protein ACJ8C4_10060 [Gemmataceae bacterium]
MRRSLFVLLAGVIGWLSLNGPARAQYPNPQLPRFYYYPYYYYPHSYWPQNSPPYPEGPGQPYQRPPAYMAYPPFEEKHWRYDLFSGQKYYRGSHFWLDQF